MLRFEMLEKRYGNKLIFSGLSHHFTVGCYALQAPNGRGKSTLLSTLAGVVPADQGNIWIADASLHTEPLHAKARMAYVPDACPVYPFLRGREFLELVASTKQTQLSAASLALITHFGLDPHLDSRFEQMSLGTKKKLMIAAASIGDPAVMIADEPGSAIDDAARQVLIDYFRQAAKHSVVLFSTHDDVLAAACDAQLIGMPSDADPTRLQTAGTLIAPAQPQSPRANADRLRQHRERSGR